MAGADDLVFRGTDRFVVRRRLGAGSFGVVYEAYDRERGATVAVKALYETAPETLLRFKREFRSLADVSHPNLVTLHELIGENDEWFFTMELVPGTDFLEYVRPGSLDLGRLRVGLGQVAQGVAALHAAGKLHRDLKPSNVRVTPEGRVVLLDFGLVTELGHDMPRQSTAAGIVGTPAYMAPEQAAEARLTEAADWYSVGVMLYEALTGRLPFDGTAIEVLLDKQTSDPIPPQELAPGTPDDLASLCNRLLNRVPEARPSGSEVEELLGTGPLAGESEGIRWTSEQVAALPFVGREVELAVLAEAFAAVRSGRAVAVYVLGESGMGKTALVRRFLQSLGPTDDAVVLAGRCYERESVPYKAMDPLIDALTRFLARVPRHEAAALVPRDAAALARLFPVLRRVEDIAQAPDRIAQLVDLQEFRQRAFGALRELLSRLSDRRPVVLFIDDLQWGDTDSARVLAEIFRPPDPPAVLLLACCRAEDIASSPMLQTLQAWRTSGDAAVVVREVAVGPLGAPEADGLARSLVELAAAGRGGGAERDALAAAISREAGGSPFFVGELVRYLGSADRPLSQGAPSLDTVLRRRFGGLPEHPRELLEVIAVAGAPITGSVALRCAGLGPEDVALKFLHSQHLIRARPFVGEERVEAYHDRIREAVVASLTPERLGARHRSLAEALQVLCPSEHEALAVHWREAGVPVRAAEHAEVAAATAADALAFDRAARWYRLAIDLCQPEGESAAALHARLGDALANAGRGAEASEAYFRAAADAESAVALEYRRRATEELLKAGYLERGLAAMRDLSPEIGMELGRTPLRALASLILRRARLRLRGLRFQERDASRIAPENLARLDTMWTAAVGLGLIDTLRAGAVHARHLRLALDVGEPHRMARALALELGYSAVLGSARYQAKIAEAAEDLVRRAESPYAAAMLRISGAIVAFHSGRFRAGTELTDQAESILREHCTGVVWETSAAQYVGLRCLWHLGRVAELANRARALIQRADDRGDRWTATMMGGLLAWSAGLALSDDPEAAARELGHHMSRWPRDEFYLPHFWAGHGGIHIALYDGDAARASEQLAAEWDRLERAQYLRVRFIRIMSLDIRARCALAAAATGGEVSRLLRQAARDASRLQRIDISMARALCLLIRGGASAVRGDRAGALTHLGAAEETFRSADMALHAAVARHRRGELLGGEEGRTLVAEAEAWMAAEGIRNPAGMCAALAPGFGP